MGYISGGGFNPAIAFAIDVIDSMNNESDRLEGTWIYFIGPLIGSVFAVAFCLILRPA
jgi:glycerol uptake facilitator-like aquaporin